MKNDITGQRFNRLTARWPAGRTQAHVYWLCSCNCGTLRVVRFGNLVNNQVKSCGCQKRESSARTGRRVLKEIGHLGTAAAAIANTTHGFSGRGGSREYRTWQTMIQRCRNPVNTNYYRYGGEGVQVCDRWLDFRNFLEDMGPRPEGKTLDRYPNPYGNYEPGNCRWATPKEQANNCRARGRRKN